MSALNLLAPSTAQPPSLPAPASGAADRDLRAFGARSTRRTSDDAANAFANELSRADRPASPKTSREASAPPTAAETKPGSRDSETVEAAEKAEPLEETSLDGDPLDEADTALDAAEVIPFEAELRVDFRLTIETPDGEAVATGSLFLDEQNPGQAQVTPLFIESSLGGVDPALLAGVPIEFKVTPLSPVVPASTAGNTPQPPSTATPTAAPTLSDIMNGLVPTSDTSGGSQTAGDEGDSDDLGQSATQAAAAANLRASSGAGESLFAMQADGSRFAADATASSALTGRAEGTPIAQPLLAGSTTADGEGSTDAINAARLQRGLANAVNQQGGNVTLRLTPPDLGTVRIHLQLQGGSVSAQFHAENESARSLLNQQLGTLRGALEAQGLSVDRLTVQSAGQPAGSSLQQQTQQQNGNTTQQDASADARNDGRSRGGSQDQQQPSQRRPENGDDADRPRRGRFRAFLND